MNRINSIRHLALAIALAGLSLVGGTGCAGEATDQDVLTGDESSRKAHYVSAQGSEDETSAIVEHSLDTRRPLVHPNSGNNLGPRPEPWMSDGEANGPRPEPWAQQGDSTDSSGSSGSSSPPSGGTNGGTTTSSGGAPGNPNPSSK